MLSMTNCSRERIIKQVLNPLTLLLWPLDNTNITSINYVPYIDIIWTFCMNIRKDSSSSMDWNIITILLCMLVNSSMDAISEFNNIQNFWNVICECFVQSDLVIRKRAAFILQNLLLKVEKNGNSSKLWYADFLTIYNQIEGCVSEHLLIQIWPLFDSLCTQVVSNNLDTNIDYVGYPVLNFNWIKGLIHCILFQTHPQIRRLILYRVFTNTVSIPCTCTTASWLFHDLISQHLDNVLFFSPNYLGRDKDIGCSQAINDAIEQKIGRNFGLLKNIADNKIEIGNGSKVINAYTRPGVLLPYFITRFMKTVTLQYTSDVNIQLLRSLIEISCGESGLKSTSAIKWIFRPFSEAAIIDMIPKFIGLTELQSIKRFFLHNFMNCNARLKEQLLQSLLPLLLKGYDVKQLGLSPLLRIIVRVISLKRIISDTYMCELLTDFINQNALKLNENGILICDLDIVDETDWSLVFTVRSLLLQGYTTDSFDGKIAITLWDQLIDEKIKVCANLYLNPYLPITQQLEAFWFTYGASSLLSILYDFLMVNGISKGKRYKAMMLTFIDKFTPILSDLSSYFSISISASLASIPTNEKDKLSFCMLSSVSIVNEIGLLDAALEILIGLILIPKISEVKVDEGYLSALAILMKFLNDCNIEIVHSNNANAYSDLLFTLTDIKKTLSLRCLSQLLFGLLKIFPQTQQDFESLSRILELTTELTFTIFQSKSPQSHSYRATLYYLSSLRPIELKENEKLSLHYNFLDQCNQFSFISIMFSDNKWSVLKYAMQVIGASSAKSRSNKNIISPPINEMLSLALEQLSVCSEEGLSSLLGCCKAAISALLPVPSNFDHNIIQSIPIETIEIVETLLETACNVTLHDGVGYIDMKLVSSLVELVFDMNILFYINFDIIVDHYNRLIKIGLLNRPHIMQCLVNHLCTIWINHHYFSIPFFSQIKRLLIYKEQKKDDNNSPEVIAFNDELLSCRIMVLTFLETTSKNISCNNDNCDVDLNFISCVQQLIVDLIEMSLQKEYATQAILGSELFGEKLRSWQALCILSNMITEVMVSQVIESYFKIIAHVCAHATRVHIEVFGGVMCSKYPHLVLPKLFAELKQFNHSQQKLSSLFVILAHYVENSLANERQIPTHFAQDIIDHIIPWLSCAAGLPRSIGQYVMSILIPIVLNDEEDLIPSSGQAYLKNILTYLKYNKDAQKVIPRQMGFFKEFSIANLCCVQGLKKIKIDNGGEILPEHMLDLIVEVLKENTDNDNMIENNGIDDNIVTSSEQITLQTKRISFDQLQLRLENELLSRSLNSSGRMRQQVVMCASLVDKATNLAGIARTCEIFAVEELVIADYRVMQSPDFQGISVNASDWLQIKEVAQENLVSYLLNMKSKGYFIVGLEQTDSSMNMISSEIPRKCVLLLGKEKEGISVELLQCCDICIEIPQYGVTRSLNVHVSAALLLWEFTKQNKDWHKNNQIKND